jgi:DNA repair exonuclease SbcCD ATPase subunit
MSLLDYNSIMVLDNNDLMNEKESFEKSEKRMKSTIEYLESRNTDLYDELIDKNKEIEELTKGLDEYRSWSNLCIVKGQDCHGYMLQTAKLIGFDMEDLSLGTFTRFMRAFRDTIKNLQEELEAERDSHKATIDGLSNNTFTKGEIMKALKDCIKKLGEGER